MHHSLRACLLPAALVLCAAFAVEADALTISGRLEWVQRAELRAVDNGVVEEVLVRPGQHVSAGELLLKMDQRAARASALRAKADVARALVAREDVERELERTQELFDRGLIATEELKDAELGLAAATAELESTKAQQALADVLLEYTELRAPFDGIIVAQNAYRGAVIYKTLQQQPLIAVAPVEQMLARALVTADVLRRYRPGQPAKVKVRGQVRDGQVYSLGVEAVRIDPSGAVYELDVIFDAQPDEILRPSELVQILLR
jgi:RND family efflux transporter MFP subunit